MSHYTIHVLNADIVQPSEVLRGVVASALEPLIRAAGYEMNLVMLPAGWQERGIPDVSVTLSRDFRGLDPRQRMLAEQSGAVLVGAILNMRVAGPVARSPLTGMDLDAPLGRASYAATTTHGDSVQLLWERGEPAFAATVGNIIVHELGHTIGGLQHDLDPINFMFTGSSIDTVLGPGFRTRTNLRRLWSGPRELNESQRQRMLEAIRARELRGMEVTELRAAP